MAAIGFIAALLTALVAFQLWRHLQKLRRAEFIRSYDWPPQLLDKLARKHPGFTRKETSLVSKGLRQFFLAYLRSGRQPVSMPSEVADQLWHEFILYTQAYRDFCAKAFGGFLHHTPAVMLSPGRRDDNAGLRASGSSAARRRTSTRAIPRACRCSSRSTPSSIFPADTATSRIARACDATAAREPPNAEAISPRRASTARPTVSVTAGVLMAGRWRRRRGRLRWRRRLTAAAVICRSSPLRRSRAG